MGLTTDPKEARESGVRADGQQNLYVVLSDDERAKGFVRPVRTRYKHVGSPGPKYPVRDLGFDEVEKYKQFGYVKYEEYPPSEETCVTGRYWTQKQLDRVGAGCGATTTMGQAIAETYARDPKFYGATFCVQCGKHYPVGEDGEFVWDDGSRVGL